MKREAVALIDEARCIGCTRCIDACPVDAIVGAQSLMHTVVEPWCIGCELCLPPCPVDCIEMVPARAGWTSADKLATKGRAAARKSRLHKQMIFSQQDTKAIVAEVLARRKR
jgi:Na+-translocating ferredoxin:NAD+ oxidoreductase subunit B